MAAVSCAIVPPTPLRANTQTGLSRIRTERRPATQPSRDDTTHSRVGRREGLVVRGARVGRCSAGSFESASDWKWGVVLLSPPQNRFRRTRSLQLPGRFCRWRCDFSSKVRSSLPTVGTGHPREWAGAHVCRPRRAHLVRHRRRPKTLQLLIRQTFGSPVADSRDPAGASLDRSPDASSEQLPGQSHDPTNSTGS